jgi:hypothetical protein
MKLRVLSTTVLLCAAMALISHRAARADAGDNATVQLNTSSMGPREIEDLTRKKILRDYAAAWKTLSAALEQNRAALLGEYFTGFAQTEFSKAVAEQSATGMHRKYTDHGHKVEGIFYSQDGGVMQLRDTAQYDEQIFDGDHLLYSQPVTSTYIVIMTPAADRWMVRLLQATPAQ